jgi:hypothetical protein
MQRTPTIWRLHATPALRPFPSFGQARAGCFDCSALMNGCLKLGGAERRLNDRNWVSSAAERLTAARPILAVPSARRFPETCCFGKLAAFPFLRLHLAVFESVFGNRFWKSGCPGRLWVRSAQPLSHVTFPFGKVGKCIRGAADRSLRSFGYMPQHSGRIVDEADRQTPRLNRRSCWGWRAKPFCNSCGIMAMPPFLAV